MSSSVRQANVAARHALFAGSWIRAMPGLLVICGVMPRSAGLTRLLRRLMLPETYVAREALQQVKTSNMSITDLFQKISEGKAVYRIRQHTKAEARYAWLIFCLTCL